MSNRATRRSELARYLRMSGRGLLTWLVDISDHLEEALLERTRDWWCAALPSVTPRRGCMVCKADFWSRDDVGAVMLTSPINGIEAGNCSIVGVCVTCWGTADQPGVSLAVIEDAGTKVLRAVIANGVFEPLGGVS